MSAKLKNAIKAINKSALICGSLGSLALSGAVFAQDSGLVEEEVVVTGIRSALKQAAEIKREAIGVVDAVSAEDIGDFPDSDVGEALGRIPGITVARQFGQGSSVSIRGASPQMTLTQLNGQNVASTGWYDQQPVDRSFNYSLLPSQLIGGIEVYKSSQADLNEGGIGGTVIVKTREPLSLDPHTVFAGLKLRTGTISDEVSPEYSGLYSFKTDNEVFGVLVAGLYEEADYVRRGTESDYRWWGDVSPTTFTQERERSALNATFQLAPTDNLSFKFNVMSLALTGDNTNTSLYLFTQPSTDIDGTAGADYWSCADRNAAGLCVRSEVPEAVRGDLAVGWASGNLGTETFIQTWGRVAEMSSDTYDLSGKFEGDSYTISASLGMTEAEGGTDMTLNFQHFPSLGDPMSLWAGSIDATGKEIKIHAYSDPSLTLDDYAATAQTQSWAIGKTPNTDEEVYAQIDAEFDLELGAIKSVKVGARRTDHEVERFNFRGRVADTLTDTPVNQIYSGTFEVGSNGFTAPEPDLDAMVSATRQDLVGWDERRGGYSLLEEENTALYAMFVFEGEGVKGNFGFRYIGTDVTRSQYVLDGTALRDGDIGDNGGYSYELTQFEKDYHDVLPSVSVTFDLTDNLILRTSAAETISRPNYDDMVVAYSGYADDRKNNETVKVGSEGLLPMKSSQADLSLEYYYGDGNIVSFTYFQKSINNFVTSSIAVDQPIGLIDPGSDGVIEPEIDRDSWTVDTLANAGGAEIDGFEVQWNHAFDNGFGFAVNYTSTNTTTPAAHICGESADGDDIWCGASVYADQRGFFTESSSDSANLVGYWENDMFSARAAYNWRSRYMIREGGFWYGNRWHDAYGSLDLSFSWAATDFLDVTFEATNILEEDSIQYGAADYRVGQEYGVKEPLREGFPAWSFEGEATFLLGVNLKF